MYTVGEPTLVVCLSPSAGKRRYNIRLWKTFTDCFNCLPVAAIISEKIFCMHGGGCGVVWCHTRGSHSIPLEIQGVTYSGHAHSLYYFRVIPRAYNNGTDSSNHETNGCPRPRTAVWSAVGGSWWSHCGVGGGWQRRVILFWWWHCGKLSSEAQHGFSVSCSPGEIWLASISHMTMLSGYIAVKSWWMSHNFMY